MLLLLALRGALLLLVGGIYGLGLLGAVLGLLVTHQIFTSLPLWGVAVD